MTQALDITSGQFQSGTAAPRAYSGPRRASALLAGLLALSPAGNLFADDPVDLSTPRSLLLDYKKNTFLTRNLSTGETLSYPAFWAMSEITRTGKAWSPNWSFRSGDPVGPLEEYATDELRGNEPPNAGPGALIETAGSSNQIRNPRFEGGQSATDPTHMSASSGLDAVTSFAFGVENGWPYWEFAINGDFGANQQISFEGLTAIAAAHGEAWAYSVGARIVSGGLTNITQLDLRMVERTSGGSFVKGFDRDITGTLDASHRRFFIARTLDGGGTVAAVQPQIDMSCSGSVALTIRFYLPQIEEAASPSSPILPDADSPAVSTRGAETRSGGLDFQRSSWAAHLDWDGTNGGIVKGLVEFLPNAPCHVPGKSLQTSVATTNEVRNPRWEGGAAGTPGTEPSYVNLEARGTALSIVGFGTEAGMRYMDVRWNGVPTAQPSIEFDTSALAAASSGETWTASCGVRVVGGDLTNLTGVYLRILERTAGGALVTGTSSGNFAVDREVRRIDFTHQLAGGGTVGAVEAVLGLSWVAGAIDITLRFYIPQLEEKPYATNPALPAPGSPAATTRGKDQAVLAVGSWYLDGGPMSLAASFRPMNEETGYVVDLVKDSSDRVNIRQLSGNVRFDSASTQGTSGSISTTLGAYTLGEVMHTCLAFETDDAVMSATGLTQASDADVDYPDTPVTLTIGAALTSSAAHANAQIDAIAYAPGRWTDAEVEACARN